MAADENNNTVEQEELSNSEGTEETGIDEATGQDTEPEEDDLEAQMAAAMAEDSGDDAVDDLRNASFHELISYMEKSPKNIYQAVNLLSVVRNLERIADHSTNIAEDVLFYVKGIDVRHHSEVRE